MALEILKCLECNETITSKFARKFCSPRCALKWRNKHDKEFYKKKVEGLRKKVMKDIPKEILEKKYFQEEKSQQEIAEELNVSRGVIKDRFKLYRIEARKKMLDKQKKLISEKNKIWTKEKILEEFGKIVSSLERTPMSKELNELGYEGLRHAIFRNFGTYSEFLLAGNFQVPSPAFGESRKNNFMKLASKAAIIYYQNGKWSSSEIKMKNILDDLGLIENIDYFHNFEILSPLRGRYKLDFYLPRFQLVIECDSFWHTIGESKERDSLRDEWILQKLNCKTLRFNKFTKERLEEISKYLEKILNY